MNSEFLKGVIVGSAIFACIMITSAPFIAVRAVERANLCSEVSP